MAVSTLFSETFSAMPERLRKEGHPQLLDLPTDVGHLPRPPPDRGQRLQQIRVCRLDRVDPGLQLRFARVVGGPFEA